MYIHTRTVCRYTHIHMCFILYVYAYIYIYIRIHWYLDPFGYGFQIGTFHSDNSSASELASGDPASQSPVSPLSRKGTEVGSDELDPKDGKDLKYRPYLDFSVA